MLPFWLWSAESNRTFGTIVASISRVMPPGRRITTSGGTPSFSITRITVDSKPTSQLSPLTTPDIRPQTSTRWGYAKQWYFRKKSIIMWGFFFKGVNFFHNHSEGLYKDPNDCMKHLKWLFGSCETCLRHIRNYSTGENYFFRLDFRKLWTFFFPAVFCTIGKMHIL